MGRAFPQLQMTTYHIFGIHAGPDGDGRRVFEHRRDPFGPVRRKWSGSAAAWSSRWADRPASACIRCAAATRSARSCAARCRSRWASAARSARRAARARTRSRHCSAILRTTEYYKHCHVIVRRQDRRSAARDDVPDGRWARSMIDGIGAFLRTAPVAAVPERASGRPRRRSGAGDRARPDRGARCRDGGADHYRRPQVRPARRRARDQRRADHALGRRARRVRAAGVRTEATPSLRWKIAR